MLHRGPKPRADSVAVAEHPREGLVIERKYLNREYELEVPMSKPLNITDDTFEQEVLQSDRPVIVDFWATWCGPCKMIAPILEEVAAEYADKLKIVKLDVDANNKTAGKYNIMSIPSLLFFKGGEMVDQVVGAIPKAQLTARVDKVIA